ncbi:MAG: GtrA family protein, partial [Candidatus Wildermuthbacteria bacterium]|nr:GtrA family protein [Candidatus Wildermuthbacteria bacterium]
VFFLSVAKNLDVNVPFLPVILVAFPVLSALGIVIAATIGKMVPALLQAAKFLLIGALNTFIDLGILNFLIAFTGFASGLSYSLFKGVSFFAAMVNSYAWNKYWTFSRKNPSQNPWKEFTRFFIVSAFGFGINVGVASFVVNVLDPQFGFSQELWANVGAIAAAFSSLLWNFLGYKLVVFRD